MIEGYVVESMVKNGQRAPGRTLLVAVRLNRKKDFPADPPRQMT